MEPEWPLEDYVFVLSCFKQTIQLLIREFALLEYIFHVSSLGSEVKKDEGKKLHSCDITESALKTEV